MNFEIDEKASIGSIMNAIRAGNKAEHIAKEINGISQKPFLNALKMAGYAYSNKAPKGWHYIGEGVEPLEKSIFEYVKRSNTKVNDSPPKVISDNTEVNSSPPEVTPGNKEVTYVSPVVHPQFTRDEVSDLMTMLQEWRMGKVTGNPQSLHDRIKGLPQGNKTRKTIVIDEEIGKRLDKYCKGEKVNKSDVLHLALLDFFNTHS